MTKRKKESQKENQVATKVPGGKITKAKYKETLMETPSTKKMQVRLVRTPLVQRQSTNIAHELMSATHSLEKSALKWTSTPLNTSTAAKNPEDKTFRSRRLIRTNLKYNAFAAPDRPPLSPIGNVINPSSNVGRDKSYIQVGENKCKENASPLPTTTRMSLRRSMRAQQSANRNRSESQNCANSNTGSTALKVSECDSISNNPGRITRRRSIGIPKASKITKTSDLLEVPKNCKNRNSNLGVRLMRSTSILNDVSSGDKSEIRDEIIPLRAEKRKLSPLIELSSYESSLSTLKHRITTSANEDDYSSSAEFESSDEKENSRSKRAPTWKDLSSKSRSGSQTSNQKSQKLSQNNRSMQVRVRKLRNHAVPGGSVLTNKDTEVISENKNENDKVPSKKLEETIVTSKEVPSQEKNKQQADINNPSEEPAGSDEKENSRSKRAPTWKDLSSKSRSASQTSNQRSQNRSQNSRSMKVRVRKLRNPAVPGGSVLTNKDTEVITEKKNDKVPSKNLEKTLVTSKEVPLQEKNKQQADMNNPSEEPAAKDCVMSPSPRSRNLLNRSDLIEEILSSPDDDAQHISPTDKTNSNSTRKFFHSHRDHTVAVVPQTVEPLITRRTSGRNKNRDKVYDFLSQSSSDSNDPAADIIQKMINNGKVVVAKHKKGTGKSVVPRGKRKVATKNKQVKPNPPSSPVKAQTPSVDAEPIDNDLAFDEGSAPYVDEEPVRDQRGFSKLARSAMIKHAGQSDNSSQRKMITDKQQLLAMAQKFVGQSTPVRVSSPRTSNVTAPFSPIPGGSSPWRVDDDRLPTTFYFDRNSDNLPTYSSDYIPSTPSKNKSRSTSSFSSNDSNGENVAPSSAPEAENQAQISSNPRRALNYRSPLKAINILEVINLPPLAIDRRNIDTPKENTNSNKMNNSAGNKSSPNISNLFGFEEIIEDDEDDVDITHQVSNAGKINLKEQLQRLKRLRDELPKTTTSRNNCIKPVFDNERQKQKTIQQMFSSTMIERQSIEPQKSMEDTNDFNGTDDSNLFKDPELTFDQSTARRSYSRPFKRKRKLRHNFVMFMDSDASEEEEDEEDVAAKNQQKKLKERKKTPKENLELKKFVNDFNAMYKEVSEYELIVE